jgi:hypothetical protein
MDYLKKNYREITLGQDVIHIFTLFGTTTDQIDRVIAKLRRESRTKLTINDFREEKILSSEQLIRLARYSFGTAYGIPYWEQICEKRDIANLEMSFQNCVT